MWERFSFYGMQAIVLLYMYYSVTDGGLGIPQATAASVVGAYGGLVYMACLLASIVADKLFGSERTLFYSAVMVMLGHIALAVIPGVTGLGIGLVLIAIGSGGVKRSEEHTSELQSRGLLVCRSLLEIKYTQLESTSTSQHTV